MDLSLRKTDLQDALAGLRPFFQGMKSNAGRLLVKLSHGDGELCVAATDGISWLRFARQSMAINAAPVVVVAQWPEMKRALSRTGGGAVTFLHSHGDALEMSVGDGRGVEKIALEPMSSWTDAPKVAMETVAFKEDFTDKLAKAVHFADEDGAREPLKGVLVEPGWMVATNGRRLVRFPVELGLKGSFVVGRCGMLEAGMLKGAGEIGVSADPARVVVKAGDWTFDAPLIKAKYPSYKQVIPDMQGLGNKVVFSPQDAKRIAEAMSQSASRSWGHMEPVFVLKEKDGVVVIRDDAKFTAVVEAKAEVTGMKEGDVLSIDRRTLLDAFKLGFRTILFSSPSSPMVAMGEDQGDLTLMPLTQADPAKVKGVVDTWRREHGGKVEEVIEVKEQPKQEIKMHEFKPQSLEKQVEAVRNEEREKTAEGLRVIGTEKQVETFDDLLEFVTELKAAMGQIKDMVNALPSKVRDVRRGVKDKERDYENARVAIMQLRKVSGF